MCRSTDPVANQVSVSTRPHLWIESATGGSSRSQLPADKRRRRQGQRAVMDLFHPAAVAAAEAAETYSVCEGRKSSRRCICQPVSTCRIRLTRGVVDMTWSLMDNRDD